MKERPFDMDYVIDTTIRRMHKNIQLSIDKTFDRVSEFADDPKKSDEIFRTLAALHSMRKDLNTRFPGK